MDNEFLKWLVLAMNQLVSLTDDTGIRGKNISSRGALSNLSKPTKTRYVNIL